MEGVRGYIRIMLVVTCLIVAPAVAVAQYNPPATPPMSLYNRENLTNLNVSFSQAFSSNWAYGDENLFLLRLALNSKLVHDLGPVVFKGTLQSTLSASYRGDEEDTSESNPLRVGDNEFFYEGVFIYPIRWIVDPYLAGSLRTAVTESFQYQRGRPEPVRMANLWDPVTSQQGAGLTYLLRGEAGTFNTRVGLALQQIRAKHHTRMTDDYLTPKIVEQYKPLSGIEFVNEAYLRGDTTVTYIGRLTMFGSFQDLDIWSVRWENETRFQLWKSFTLSWTFNLIHDVRQTRRTQFRQAILLGINQDF
jgi:hypothetical protein